MLNKHVNIDSIMTFIAWLRANDILFLKDYGSLDTNTNLEDGKISIEIETADPKEILTDFQDEGFLPDELKVEHVIKEINYRLDEINPNSSKLVIDKKEKTRDEFRSSRLWDKEEKKSEEGGLWGK